MISLPKKNVLSAGLEAATATFVIGGRAWLFRIASKNLSSSFFRKGWGGNKRAETRGEICTIDDVLEEERSKV